jgi:hypothetical protein
VRQRTAFLGAHDQPIRAKHCPCPVRTLSPVVFCVLCDKNMAMPSHTSTATRVPGPVVANPGLGRMVLIRTSSMSFCSMLASILQAQSVAIPTKEIPSFEEYHTGISKFSGHTTLKAPLSSVRLDAARLKSINSFWRIERPMRAPLGCVDAPGYTPHFHDPRQPRQKSIGPLTPALKISIILRTDDLLRGNDILIRC